MALVKHYPDILDCIANLSNDEVFTPPVLANKILDLLPKEVWKNPNLKWLDPCCKTGVFLREIAKRLWIGLAKEIPNESERKEHIFKNMIYGIAITELTGLSSRRSLYYSKNAQSSYSIFQFDNIEGNIFYENINHNFINENCNFCGASESEFSKKNIKNNEMHAYNFIHQEINTILKGKNMKFDIIVGNPPYQIDSGGFGAQAKPIYQYFIQKAKELNPKYISFIIPSRWFIGGMGLDEFRKEMLNDKNIKILVDFPDSSVCFPGVEIKGGVCYFLWEKEFNKENKKTLVKNHIIGEKFNEDYRDLNQFDVFVRFNKAISILNKVLTFKEDCFSNMISSVNPFKLNTNFKEYTKKEFSNAVKLYLRGGTGWVDNSYLTSNNQWIDKYKVLISRAYGAGEGFPHQIIGKPIVTEKNSCCTMTYLVAGVFENKSEAENASIYMQTKFFRFLVALKKTTQDISKDRFSFVPLIDFSIKWTDVELYKKYNLTQDEIDFIESMIKPIE